MSATDWCNVHNIENRLPLPEFLGLSGPSIHVHLSPFMSIRVNESVARSVGRTTSATVHDGAYSYDNGGRLSQVIDSATNLTEEYTWNADNTLATMPGPNYTREFGYNEEAQLLSISHSGTLAYQYAYGADGNRRWAKDIANNAWTWYPCGVACGAGELVEQGSDLTGSTWTTNAQYLRAGGGCSSMLIRRKSSTDDEYHHEDPLGVFGVITGANAATLSSNVYDMCHFEQYSLGTANSRWRFVDSFVDFDDALGPCIKWVGRIILAAADLCKCAYCYTLLNMAEIHTCLAECNGSNNRAPKCSDIKSRFPYTTPDAALRSCTRPGEKCVTKKRENAKGCQGGGGSHLTYKCGRSSLITVLCCPCTGPSGTMERLCNCNYHPAV